jgi:O-antigen/teichoic acid export membrane protein
MINQLQKIFRKSKFILYTQVIDKIFFFFLFLVIARTLTTDDYGKIIIIFSISNILLTIMQFGLPVYFQRQTANEKKINLTEFNISIIYGLASFVLSLVAILFVTSIFYNIKQYLIVILIHSFVFSFYFISIFNSFLLGLNEQRIQVQSYGISRIMSLSLILLVYFFIKNIDYYFMICSIGNVLIIFILYNFLLNRFISKGKKSDVTFVQIKGLIVLTLPLGLAAVSNFLYDKIDVILISGIIDIEHVAYYNIAYGIYKASQISFSFILVAGYSRVSSLSRSNYAVKLFLKKYFITILILSGLIFVTLVIFSKSIIVLLYGEKYYSSILILQLLSLAIIPLALNNLTGITLNGLGMFRENLKVMISALFINILANIILLNTLGILGAVYATLITEVYILVMGIIYLRLKIS